mmetsp:Transcript_17237/g.32183  ORF Transcript_17237/g.32183 Transcript_17237/m.32183 type:complete len:187 (+) Transcript_17237:412-972(+)|eukprot:scaffold14477_cov164-Amphora_coffeaeformis.AAC.5
MLDGETKLCEASAAHPRVICWSNSGKAFRIYDTTEFANVVLPKYFRTKKFSSFQRNLNLYGFTKIRRGPDVDMYAHPSFVRDTPHTLLELRKITNGGRKRPTEEVTTKYSSRTVSPLSTLHHHVEHEPTSPVTGIPKIIVPKVQQWGSSTVYSSTVSRPSVLSPVRAADRGKLDLLAMALEQEAAH